MAGSIRIGIAGWVFPEWRGIFYPQGLPQKNELAYASSQLRTIEINATFYANQKPSSFANWAGETPEGFRFTVKGPKFITHNLKLKNAATPLANFMASGPLRLGERLGPFVWQLPSPFKFDAERVEAFLELLPQTPDEAGRLAREHDDRLKEPAFTTVEGIERIRHAMEARDPSFATREFAALLRKYNVALVTPDTAAWPYRDLTADFVYARLQGPANGAGSGYGEEDLDAWAELISKWSAGGKAETGPLLAEPMEDGKPRDVYAFFVHEDKLHAPRNAKALMQRLGVAPPGEKVA